ncbi:putative UDP-Gal or UDP-GlcNAc-dependent glycosyltransferase [Trypanosoma cruzi]|uniref:Putative UDP-Gal or UDP-GlcNAc-dependent glycosyltransferase n=1 Tax=Trypanosoma cruzi TaxID=5693 RepID=A0A2V2V4G8_TRYCR|nr:putative UDP-Gal or UDP-GlcNAc-dependent glycosyltransferase [Trypanosoma cruzi]
MWFDLGSVCFRPRGTLRRAMTTCFSVCRCSLLTCASCRAEGSTWGFIVELFGEWPFSRCAFMVGWCYTMSRDVAEALVSFKPLRRLAHTPYSKERRRILSLVGSRGHDGWHVLLEEVKYQPLIHVKVLPCHFLQARSDTGESQVVPTSMCVHHVREDDYAALMARFGNDTSPVARLWQYSEDVIYPSCD